MLCEFALVQVHKSYNLAASFSKEYFVLISLKLWELSLNKYCAALSDSWKIFFVKIWKLFLTQYWLDDVQNAVRNGQITDMSIAIVLLSKSLSSKDQIIDQMCRDVFNHVIHLSIKSVWSEHIAVFFANLFYAFKTYTGTLEVACG